jgi:hypothetical protein
MDRTNGAGVIDFNFTPEQKERFNLLWVEIEKTYPNFKDPVMNEKAKVILAHHIINENKDNDNGKEVYVEEIKNEVINKDNDTK